MRAIRIVLRAAAGGAAALALLALIGYGMVSATPSQYRPARLTLEQQDQAMRAFINHITDFGDKAGAGRPFAWTITDRQANSYLAAMDAIASLPFDRRVEPSGRLARQGLAEPALAFNGGMITVMARSTRHDKVFSADLALEFDGQGRLTARVVAVRVGVMPIPRAWVQAALAGFRAQAAAGLTDAGRLNDASLGPVPYSRFAQFLGKVLDLLGGQPVRPEVVWPLGRHRVLVERLESAGGQLIVHAVPAR